MQTKDDGTHVILPVADALAASLDHARLPVMMLRHSDGKVRSEGSRTATSSPIHPSLSAEDCTAHRGSQPHCREVKNGVQCKRGETTVAKKIRLIPPIRTGTAR